MRAIVIEYTTLTRTDVMEQRCRQEMAGAVLCWSRQHHFHLCVGAHINYGGKRSPTSGSEREGADFCLVPHPTV